MKKIKQQLNFPHLAIDAIHVWQASLSATESQIEGFWQTLDQQEQARANRFVYPQHRTNFIIARGVLRQLLASYIACPPQAVKFQSNHYGKLSLAGIGLPLQFNLSHAGDIAMYAFVWSKPIGVDVEKVRQEIDVLQIASRFFSPEESEKLASFAREQQLSAFFSGWTRKEAFIKAIGMGLSYALDKFAVDLTPERDLAKLKLTILNANRFSGLQAKRLEPFVAPPGFAPPSGKPKCEEYKPGMPLTAKQWSLFNLNIPSSYFAALAVAGDFSPAQITQYIYTQRKPVFRVTGK